MVSLATSCSPVHPHHIQRKAVVYIRQSTQQQVLTNVESQRMQRAMREHAERLGWPEERIETVEIDTGQSGQTTTRRDGYQMLLAEISQGLVGIVLSYESARLSRNCTDWFPLLDMCAFRNCLVADRDGVYDPSNSSSRLLLGMKGMLSEYELHTLRGRLIAGSLNKARRGELALNLPAGFLRLEDGRVVKDPDREVQEAILRVFGVFAEHPSGSSVARWLRRNRLKLPRRLHQRETVWRKATTSRVLSILKNPAYAGAFVYGKIRNERRLEADGTQRSVRCRHDVDDGTVVVKDRYPHYIDWNTFEKIQTVLRDNRAEYTAKLTRGVARKGTSLLQGIAYCGECGLKLRVQYQRHGRYRCDHLDRETGGRVCQSLLAEPIDRAVVGAFFEALAPAELDLYEEVIQQRRLSSAEVRAAKGREIERLKYEADFARRQYDKVDPDNRRVASELESRWEEALRALEQAELEARKHEHEERSAVEESLPEDLKEALRDLGQSLPKIWDREDMTQEQRKGLLRCLIDKVVMKREPGADHVHIRIIWKGGLDTELEVPIAIGAFAKVPRRAEMVQRMLDLEAQGKSDEDIARVLTEEGFRSPKETAVLPATVRVERLRQGRVHRYRKPRDKHVPGCLTVPQIAKALGVRNEWIYWRIKTGAIQARRDPETGLFLFPDSPEMIETLRTLLRTVRARQ